MIAIVSDIHSNIEALTAVMEDIARIDIEKIYCLGDVVGYGPNPVECLNLAQKFKFVLKGNHENAIINGTENFNRRAALAIKWTRQQLITADNVGMERQLLLQTLEESKKIQKEFFCHGSPRDPIKEYLFVQDADGTPKIKECFDKIEHLSFVGHTHMPGVFSPGEAFQTTEALMNIFMVEKEKAIINVGSVGQPRDRDPRACYATFDGECVVFRRVEYDAVETRKKIHAIDDLDNSLGDRLIEGR